MYLPRRMSSTEDETSVPSIGTWQRCQWSGAVKVRMAIADAAARERRTAQEDSRRRVADGQPGDLHVEVADGLDVVAQEVARQLGGEDQRGPVLGVQRQVSGGGLDRLQVADAGGGHVEGVRSLEAQLGGDLHRRRRLEVLARDAAADHQIDLVERDGVGLQAVVGRRHRVVGDAAGAHVRLDVADLRLAQPKDVLDGRGEGGELGVVPLKRARTRRMVSALSTRSRGAPHPAWTGAIRASSRTASGEPGGRNSPYHTRRPSRRNSDRRATCESDAPRNCSGPPKIGTLTVDCVSRDRRAVEVAARRRFSDLQKR